VGAIDRSRRELWAHGHAANSGDKVKAYIDLGVKRGRGARGRRTVNSACKAYENGFFLGGLVVRSREAEHEDLSGRDFRAGVAGGAGPRISKRRRLLPSKPPIRANGRGHLHARRRCGRASSRRACRSAWFGINVPIPVPLAYHTFGGWEAFGFSGDGQPAWARGRCASSTKNQDGHGALGPKAGVRGRLELRHPDDAIGDRTRIVLCLRWCAVGLAASSLRSPTLEGRTPSPP